MLVSFYIEDSLLFDSNLVNTSYPLIGQGALFFVLFGLNKETLAHWKAIYCQRCCLYVPVVDSIN